jgi:hypothetical protein
VRDTKHNATVTTLLDMFLAANPEKGKTDEEKEDSKKKYSPGDEVMPKVEAREKTLRERRVEDEDRRLMNEVRNLSLREVGVESSEARRERRRREEGRSHGSRSQSSRDNSRDHRGTEDRERRRRREAEAERRRARDDINLHPGVVTENQRRRRSDEDSSRRHEETQRTAVRQIEHQSSLRSLISSSDVDSHEMEEEILRQIREEGLLDGIDLENIDVNQEDQISERIAEAFRRRQSERARNERPRRSDASGRRSQTRDSAPVSRDNSGDENPRPTRRRATHSRSPSGTSQGDEPSRPPPAMSAIHAAHLEVHSGDEGRRRRRTTSSSQSSTALVAATEVGVRPAARSQTDLKERPRSQQMSSARPLVTANAGNSTDPNVQRAVELPASELFGRESQFALISSSDPRTGAALRAEDPANFTPTNVSKARATPPAEIFVPSSTPSAASVGNIDRSLLPLPLSPRAPGPPSLSDRATALSSGSRPSSSSSPTTRSHPEFYPEPSLTCARCSKPHIEYELHYNCGICLGGNYNICLSCYRVGRGCLYWFGFGYAAFVKWQNQTLSGQLPTDAERPHMLHASRYIPPKISAGGADGRRTLTTDDPQKRLQSGVFCANCLAWANECYWRCDICNEGDWGFCNLCVNQGRSCTHPLLPLAYKPSESYAPPLSPTQDQKTPPSATVLTGPNVVNFGSFKPLSFATTCDVCHYPIQPSNSRFHCFSCKSRVPNTQAGDYDICTNCYPKLVTSRRISAENGPNGWRRCLRGHRMIIVGFEDNRGGQRRIIVQDLVGGRGLIEEPSTSMDHAGADLQVWSWGNGVHINGDRSHRKLVTSDVMKTAPTSSPGMAIETGFPPDGGVGMKAVAIWGWYPAEGADDELPFPKGAEIKECKDVNTDWYFGTYMGRTGLFQANYVRILDTIVSA